MDAKITMTCTEFCEMIRQGIYTATGLKVKEIQVVPDAGGTPAISVFDSPDGKTHFSTVSSFYELNTPDY